MYQHPQYVGLFVYEGQKGDKPKAGAFFKPKHGMTLTQVCWNAYGSGYDKLVYARKVNANPWNVEMGRADLVVYRNSDSNCSAKKVSPDSGPGAAAAPFGSGPWIAQCPFKDPNQVFWVPPKDQWDKRPEDLSASKPYVPPSFSYKPPEEAPAEPLPGMQVIGGGEDGEGIIEEPAPKDGSKKWWIIGGISAAVLAAGLGIYAWRKRKK